MEDRNPYNDKNKLRNSYFDTSTREIEFYQNPYRLFNKFYYDDSHHCDDMLNYDLTEYEGCYVKVVVIQKTDFYTFDRFIDRCYNEGNFYELKIVEDFSDLDPNTIADSAVEEIWFVTQGHGEVWLKEDAEEEDATDLVWQGL